MSSSIVTTVLVLLLSIGSYASQAPFTSIADVLRSGSGLRRADYPPWPVVIDTDMGYDDIVAISLVLQNPYVKVIAITITDGLAHVPAGTDNMRRILARLNRTDIIVASGSTPEGPGIHKFVPKWRELCEKLTNISLPDASSCPPASSVPASSLLVTLAEENPNLSVLALGPLTNIKDAIYLSVSRPTRFYENVGALVLMGGALLVEGNADTGNGSYAEWNFYADVRAAQTVFNSQMFYGKIFMTPLDVTNQSPYLDVYKAVASIPRSSNPHSIGLFLQDVLASAVSQNFQTMHDPCAALFLAQVPVFSRMKVFQVRIQESGLKQGMSEVLPREDHPFTSSEVVAPIALQLNLYLAEFQRIVKSQS